MTILRSRDNPRVRRWASLVQDGALRRRQQRAIVEGPHLVASALERGRAIEALVVSESGLKRPEIAALAGRAGIAPTVLDDRLFRGTFDAETPQGIAIEIAIGEAPAAQRRSAVFLEGVQDPGNVGTMIRSAAAFGAAVVVADGKCADPWSPKALRAGMGGHFSLAVRHVTSLEPELRAFSGSLVAAVSHGGVPLPEADLRAPVGWLFGSEGAGLSEAVLACARERVTIRLDPSAESLNVAAAAAICLYEMARREGVSRPAAGS